MIRMQRQNLSETELLSVINNTFASHEQSAGSKVETLLWQNNIDPEQCNWVCGYIDHGDNLPHQYETLRHNLIKQCQDNFNVQH